MDQEKIGKFIKDLRIKNNLTQKEFADKYNVTYQAVSKWENGKNIPDISILKQMSKDFNIDINDLLDGETSKKKIKTSYYIIGIIIILFIMLIILIFKNFWIWINGVVIRKKQEIIRIGRFCWQHLCGRGASGGRGLAAKKFLAGVVSILLQSRWGHLGQAGATGKQRDA